MQRDPHQIAIEQSRDRYAHGCPFRERGGPVASRLRSPDTCHQKKITIDGITPLHSMTRHAHSGRSLTEWIAELVHQRRQQKPGRIAALQDARGDAARARRPLLERKRHPGRPHAAHADAEESTEGEQHQYWSTCR